MRNKVFYIIMTVSLAFSCDEKDDINTNIEPDKPLNFTFDLSENYPGSIWPWEKTLVLIQDLDGNLLDSVTLAGGQRATFSDESVTRFTLTEISMSDNPKAPRRINTYFSIKSSTKGLKLSPPKPIVSSIDISLGDVDNALICNYRGIYMEGPYGIGTPIFDPDNLYVGIRDNEVPKYNVFPGIGSQNEFVINKSDITKLMASKTISLPINSSILRVANDLLRDGARVLFDDVYSTKRPFSNPLTFYYPDEVLAPYIPNFMYKVNANTYRNYFFNTIPNTVVESNVKPSLTNKNLKSYAVNATGDFQVVLGTFYDQDLNWTFYSDKSADLSKTVSEIIRIIEIDHPELKVDKLQFSVASFFNYIGIDNYDSFLEIIFDPNRRINNEINELRVLDVY
ncbi:MAG: hypothetical protein RLO12_09240 [Fulvivirga sp.]